MGIVATYSREKCAPGKTYPTPKNRVWGNFENPNKTHLGNRRQPLKTHLKNRLTHTGNASGVLFYGYRYYDPNVGRWPSRDPIEEQGGLNLYGFVDNSAINGIDLLGNNPLHVPPSFYNEGKECSSDPAKLDYFLPIIGYYPETTFASNELTLSSIYNIDGDYDSLKIRYWTCSRGGPASAPANTYPEGDVARCNEKGDCLIRNAGDPQLFKIYLYYLSCECDEETDRRKWALKRKVAHGMLDGTESHHFWSHWSWEVTGLFVGDK